LEITVRPDLIAERADGMIAEVGIRIDPLSKISHEFESGNEKVTTLI